MKTKINININLFKFSKMYNKIITLIRKFGNIGILNIDKTIKNKITFIFLFNTKLKFFNFIRNIKKKSNINKNKYKINKFNFLNTKIITIELE